MVKGQGFVWGKQLSVVSFLAYTDYSSIIMLPLHLCVIHSAYSLSWNVGFQRNLNDEEVGESTSLLTFLENFRLVPSRPGRRLWSWRYQEIIHVHPTQSNYGTTLFLALVTLMQYGRLKYSLKYEFQVGVMLMRGC